MALPTDFRYSLTRGLPRTKSLTLAETVLYDCPKTMLTLAK